jgi:hypothetical protein
MDHRIGLPGFQVGGSTRWTRHDVWPPEIARDEWWLDETTPTARERLLAHRLDCLRQVVRWLFVNGGISVVFLFGLMAFGLIAAIFESR